MQPEDDPTEKQQQYRELRERTERQRRRREQFLERIALERIAQEQRTSLRSVRRPSPGGESVVTETIEGPAPGEDSSVPPDPPRSGSAP